MRTAPGVDRAVAVLTVLGSAPGRGDHGERGMTLAEIVRRTSLSKATCHAVLASLVEARWLLRHPDGPTYRLGPGLIALGEAAQRGYPALPYAQDAMALVGEELQLECMATAIVDGEIAILAKAGVPAPLSVSATPGQRIPLLPPLASVFLAWWSEARVTRLMRQVAGRSLPLEDYLATLEAVRRRGYTAAQETPSRQLLGKALAAGARSGRTSVAGAARMLQALEVEDYQLRKLSDDGSYRLNHIAAPVFDSNGEVCLALTLIGFSGEVPGREVRRIGTTLRAHASEVTSAIHGVPPATGAGCGDQPAASAGAW